MTGLGRRAFMAASAACIAAPTALGAKECPMAGLDWITMSLEERNLAYNNVVHVGPENARKKTERDSPHVNDKVKLSEEEIQKLSPMRLPIVNKPLGIA